MTAAAFLLNCKAATGFSSLNSVNEDADAGKNSAGNVDAFFILTKLRAANARASCRLEFAETSSAQSSIRSRLRVP